MGLFFQMLDLYSPTPVEMFGILFISILAYLLPLIVIGVVIVIVVSRIKKKKNIANAMPQTPVIPPELLANMPNTDYGPLDGDPANLYNNNMYNGTNYGDTVDLSNNMYNGANYGDTVDLSNNNLYNGTDNGDNQSGDPE